MEMDDFQEKLNGGEPRLSLRLNRKGRIETR